jgi:hypothetical protein
MLKQDENFSEIRTNEKTLRKFHYTVREMKKLIVEIFLFYFQSSSRRGEPHSLQALRLYDTYLKHLTWLLAHTAYNVNPLA